MEIKKLKCPECGANFESNQKVSFCSYCGAKLFFDDGTKTINYNYKTEDVAKIREIEVNRELELNKRQEEKKGNKNFLIGMILFIAIFIIGFASLFGGIKNESDKQEKELQSLVNEIYIDINNGNYDSALIKANSLHYTADWSHEIEEKWNDTRESLIKIIEGKMKN